MGVLATAGHRLLTIRSVLSISNFLKTSKIFRRRNHMSEVFDQSYAAESNQAFEALQGALEN